MIGEAWRQKVALSVLGDAKGDLMPDTVFISLIDSSGNEVTDRVEVPNDDIWEGAPEGVTNAEEIYVGETTGMPATVIIWDAPEGGNEILFAEIDEPEEGDATIPVGGIIFEVN